MEQSSSEDLVVVGAVTLREIMDILSISGSGEVHGVCKVSPTGSTFMGFRCSLNQFETVWLSRKLGRSVMELIRKLSFLKICLLNERSPSFQNFFCNTTESVCC